MKDEEAITVPMLDARCKLISIFNEDMNATRKMKSVVLKKDGPKKALSPLYVCMGYGATNTLFEAAGKRFDEMLQAWKSEVEEGVKKLPTTAAG